MPTTAERYAALKAELAKSDLSALSQAAAAAKLASETITRLVPGRFLDMRGVRKVLTVTIGPTAATAAITALRSAAAASPNTDLADAVGWLDGNVGDPLAGLDFGDPVTQAALDALSGTVLTAEAATVLKAYGTETVTRGSVAFLGVEPSAADVQAARTLY